MLYVSSTFTSITVFVVNVRSNSLHLQVKLDTDVLETAYFTEV